MGGAPNGSGKSSADATPSNLPHFLAGVAAVPGGFRRARDDAIVRLCSTGMALDGLALNWRR